MKPLRGLLALAIVVGIAQSCTNDFDKFEVGAGGSGASTSKGGTVNQAGTTSSGGNVVNVGGDNGAAGADIGVGGAAAAGASGAGGAACDETDILHCGECDRACSSSGVAALECSGGTCTSSCAPGSANCSQPEATEADDGCETDVSADPAQCGGCDNACPSGFECDAGQCACNNTGDCGNGGGVDCVSGQCECDNVLCRPGEECRSDGGDRLCSCNGSDDPGCLANEFCCAAGCTDVVSSEQNCGACGRSCTTGFACVASACECDSAEDCGGLPAGAGGAGGAASTGGAAGAPTNGGAGGSTSGGTSSGAASGAPAGGAGGEPVASGGAGGEPVASGGVGGEPVASGGAGGASEPSPNIACVVGRCVCSGSTCSEGQRCLPSGSCG